eukprot:gnl/MRDRNA2_/MRDRNA2_88162_c0_seq1.p1 gnl/MRDRNA2_/MRDRNA2_88162_c0~~gnl/MRDRNA2_/MRDRNA2_88162_c0_seq1.p1  ORF type:complete len:859 (-),score=193.91 gnl/MRDRNA2_/MRDRNA2_88162_c0_seq1:296-2872(-)
MSIAELAKGAAIIEAFGASIRDKPGAVTLDATQVLAICDVIGGLRAENSKQADTLKTLEKNNAEIKRSNNTVMQKFSGFSDWENEVNKSLQELRDLVVPKEQMDGLQDRLNKLEKSFEKTDKHVEARLSTVMESIAEKNDKRKTQTFQLEDKVNLLQVQVTDLSKRLREEKHRVENSSDHAFRAADTTKKLQTQLSDLEETLKGDFKKVAKVVKALQDEVKSRPAGTASMSFSTGAGGDASMTAADIKDTGGQMKLRVERLEEREAEVHSLFDRFSKRIRKLEENDSVALVAALSKKFTEMNVRHEHFEQHMADQLFNLRSKEVSHVVTAFKQKWARYNKENEEFLVRECLTLWLEYLSNRMNARRALAKTNQLFVTRHAGSRFRTWWYVTQKDLHRKEFEHLNDYANSMQAQLTTATSTMSKRDKSTSEHFREISVRVNQAEKKLDTIQQKKADTAVVRDLVGTLEARFAQDYDFDGVRRSIDQVWAFVRPLETNKAEASIVETHARKLNELAYELRQGFQKHDEALSLKATIIDMSRKADAMRVDEVMKVLASQMDRLTAITTEDFEQLRLSVQRFLELSPDLRKAALSNGLTPREECMACSMLNKSARGKKEGLDPVQTIQGTNNVLYRLSPTAGRSYSQQADKIIQDKLKFPTRLKQSVNMAREANMDTPLRSLINQGAAWLSGAEVTRTQDARRGSNARASVSSAGGGGDDNGNRFSLRAFFPSAGGAPQQQHNQSTSEHSTVSKHSMDADKSPISPAKNDLDRAFSPMPTTGFRHGSIGSASDDVSPSHASSKLAPSPIAPSPLPPGEDDDDEPDANVIDENIGNADGYAGMQDFEEGSYMSSNASGGEYDD